MISCTEFIAAYSELFTYLDERYGRAEVERFWTYLFEPTGKGIPLINYAKKDGLRGCFNYWCGTLKEEAADTVRYLNEEQGWLSSEMRYCPSKGRLLELEKEIGFKPYYDYCGHCDYYRASISEVGLCYLRIHTRVNEAKCESVIYDPKRFKGICTVDENTEVLDIKPGDNEYFHPDFHSSMNNGIHYLGDKFGIDDVKAYLTMFTKHAYVKIIEDIKARGIDAIVDKIRDTYANEKASDVLSITKDGEKTVITIKYCPAVKHLKATGRVVSPWYRYTTHVVMDTLAKEGGLTFTMESYDEETGAARYSFC